MFAGIDIASERHMLARLDAEGESPGRPIPVPEDQAGHMRLIKAPGPPLIVMEATGHSWKNLFAVLAAAGHDGALLNPVAARRGQDASPARTRTDAIDAAAPARLAFAKRPAPTRLFDEAAEALRARRRHRDRLRQDAPLSAIAPRTLANDDRLRQLHRLVDPGLPGFTRYLRSLDSMRATALIAEYPTVQAFARAPPRRLARLRHHGRHFVGAGLAEQLVAAARRPVGRHHGPVHAPQARHLCQDLDLWRRRPAEIDRDIEGLLDAHELGKRLRPVDGIGPHPAARIIAAVGDPGRFRSAAAFAAHVGVVPGLGQSGKTSGRIRAPIAPMGNARLRRALWMPVRGAVRRTPWLRAFHERLRAAGRPPRLALVAAMRKLLTAVCSVARNRRPFVIQTEQARAAHTEAAPACGPRRKHLMHVTVSHGALTRQPSSSAGFRAAGEAPAAAGRIAGSQQPGQRVRPRGRHRAAPGALRAAPTVGTPAAWPDGIGRRVRGRRPDQRGRIICTRNPPSSGLASRISRPPWPRTTSATIARPSPTPGPLPGAVSALRSRLRAASSRAKGCSASARRGGGMPGPSSSTLSRRAVGSGVSRTTQRRPWRSALAMRLSSARATSCGRSGAGTGAPVPSACSCGTPSRRARATAAATSAAASVCTIASVAVPRA